MRLSKRGLVFGLLTLALVSLTAHRQAFGASESVLSSFGDGTNGPLYPYAGLLMDASGTLYGTTIYGGAYFSPEDYGGTVFKLTPPSSSGGTWTESILWNFGNGTDGQYLGNGSLITDANGNLYGTTIYGGTYGVGVLFKLTPPPTSGDDWTESILWNFGNGSDGVLPIAGLLMDASGNLYGTTSYGGTYGVGVLFKLTPPPISGGNWAESILWNFGNGADGQGPLAGLLIDTSGNLYGTTWLGGAYGRGTIFELSPLATSGNNWTELILWNFGNGTDGAEPYFGGLIMDESGNLYGTTYQGGYSGCSVFGGSGGCGTVFELTPPLTAGGNWTESILWRFSSGADGYGPTVGLVMDKSGDLYGTTFGGGAYGESGSGCINFEPILGCGTVFELTPISIGNWEESKLWSFGNGTDGAEPLTGLIMDKSGDLYGTTIYGGVSPGPLGIGGGTVFEISDIGGSSTPTPTPTSMPPTPTVTPTATPTPATVLTISPAKLSFGNIDATASSKTKKLTLHNTSKTAAAVIGQLSSPASFTISSDGCSNQTIQPKKSCTVEVAFVPATVIGSVSEALLIPYNGTSPTETLIGTGIAATLKAPSSKTLPSVAAGSISKAEDLTIANRSAAMVQVGAASTLSDFVITADGCANVSLAPKARCVVTLEFAPAGGATGTLSGVLSYNFTYGANSGSVATTLKGKVK
jgi:uncharacterized repeat protein (TIGR03803 family)